MLDIGFRRLTVVPVGGGTFFFGLRRRHVSRSSANEVSDRKKRVSAPALASGKIGYD